MSILDDCFSFVVLSTELNNVSHIVPGVSGCHLLVPVHTCITCCCASFNRWVYVYRSTNTLVDVWIQSAFLQQLITENIWKLLLPNVWPVHVGVSLFTFTFSVCICSLLSCLIQEAKLSLG